MSDINDTAEVTRVWEDYQIGVNYQNRMGFVKDFRTFVDFYEGRQWPAPTKKTKNLPRPVINLIKMICRNKKSAILSMPVRLVYRTSAELSEVVDVEKFNNFAAYIERELGQAELDKRAIHDGVRKGSYFYHYYWDAEARGKDGTRAGALRGELIDPLSIFFADPTERDEQKQEWIIIATREHVRSVRQKADPGVDIGLITASESDDKYGVREQEGDKLCTVLTRYFRKNGEVWFEKATKAAVINAPRPLAPDVEAARRELKFDEQGELEIDPPNNSLPDSDDSESLTPKRARAIFYPVVAGSYEPREKSIYGLGEVEGLIPNQKLINFMLGMMALAIQEQAWGKYVVHPDALKNQKITNEPGETLIDYTGTGMGIKKLSEQAVHSIPLDFIDTISNLTRVVTGSSEVMTGETLGASMSGAAIAQLQAQAQMPTEELRADYHLQKAKTGKVMAQFFKLFYADTEFVYEVEDEQSESGKTIKRSTFNSAEFRDIDFDVVVEACAGTRSSTMGDIAILETLLTGGHISIETFINSYPDDALSNRTAILKGIRADKEDALKLCEAEIEKLKAELNQYAAALKDAQATAQQALPLMQENKRLREMLLALYNEASQKIVKANEQIAAGNIGFAEKSAEADEAKADASEFANHIMQTEFQTN